MGPEFTVDSAVAQNDDSIGYCTHVGQIVADEDNSLTHLPQSLDVVQDVGRLRD